MDVMRGCFERLCIERGCYYLPKWGCHSVATPPGGPIETPLAHSSRPFVLPYQRFD